MSDDGNLLEEAREELYHVRVLVRGLRNRTKTDAAALHDSELRLEGLIARLEARLNGSPGQRRPTEDDHELTKAEAH